MNKEQHLIDTLLQRVRQGQKFAIDASGGTGKTYVLTVILHKLRLENKNAPTSTHHYVSIV